MLYVKSVELDVGEEIMIPSDVAFDALIENMVQEADEELEQLYLDAIETMS